MLLQLSKRGKTQYIYRWRGDINLVYKHEVTAVQQGCVTSRQNSKYSTLINVGAVNIDSWIITPDRLCLISWILLKLRGGTIYKGKEDSQW